MKDYDEERRCAKQLHCDGMTAEQHVRRAERLLAGEEYSDGDPWKQPSECDVTRAQVHATLAVALAAIEARQATIEAPEIRPAVPHIGGWQHR